MSLAATVFPLSGATHDSPRFWQLDMTFSFPLTFTEHYRAYRTAFHRKPSAWAAYAFFLLLPVGVVAAAIAKGWTMADVWRQNWQLLVLGPLFVLVGAPWLHRLNVRQQRKGNRSLEGVQSLVFSEDGIRMWGPLWNASFLWPAVHEVVETRRYLLIYLSAVQFFFVPREAVGDASSWTELRNLLRSALGNRVRLASTDQAAA
jgi:YcxB-like protein